MGAEAAQLLMERIGDPDCEGAAEIVMEPELILRESTGPAPQRPMQAGLTRSQLRHAVIK